jgi:hypothetical protein
MNYLKDNLSSVLKPIRKVCPKVLGGYSQNFLRKFVKIAVTLGFNSLRFYRSKVFFQSKYQ